MATSLRFLPPSPPAPACAGKKLLQHDGPLSEVDPEISNLITKEKSRQVRGFWPAGLCVCVCAGWWQRVHGPSSHQPPVGAAPALQARATHAPHAACSGRSTRRSILARDCLLTVPLQWPVARRTLRQVVSAVTRHPYMCSPSTFAWGLAVPCLPPPFHAALLPLLTPTQTRGLELIASENFTSTAVSVRAPAAGAGALTGPASQPPLAHAPRTLAGGMPCFLASTSTHTASRIVAHWTAGDASAGQLHDQQVL